jgi:hypothetical protein
VVEALQHPWFQELDQVLEQTEILGAGPGPTCRADASAHFTQVSAGAIQHLQLELQTHLQPLVACDNDLRIGKQAVSRSSTRGSLGELSLCTGLSAASQSWASEVEAWEAPSMVLCDGI